MSALTTYSENDIVPGDIVAVQHGPSGRKEGLVVGTRFDYAGRQILEVRLDAGEIYTTPWHYVTRVRRTISYGRNNPLANPNKRVERVIYW